MFRNGRSKHHTSVERRILMDHKWAFSFLLIAALHPIAGVKSYSRDPGPSFKGADASLMSCGPEKQADALSKCANDLCSVTREVTMLPSGEELCGYVILNILPELDLEEDESFVALKRAKRELPACTTCTTEEYLLDSAGKILRGPKIRTEIIKTSAPSAVEFQASFEATQGIVMSWETPHTVCNISRYQISYSVLDLNDPQQPKTTQSINLDTHYSNYILDNVKHNSLYEVCMIAVAVGEASGPETCKSIVIPKLVAPDVGSLSHTEENVSTTAAVQPSNVPVVDDSSSEKKKTMKKKKKPEKKRKHKKKKPNQSKSNSNGVNPLPVQGLMIAAIVLLTAVLL
ncbi:uncharacterized protein LOC108665461 [Hyalella azteca]|uniref:Uncharacterized protein LOC108665461 n=1 Tax=Hyalella azteca TaxID=294128 RepID=A0A8B7N2A2_HYAAZ|nr:uncharacterized protein LOC108665461 [Hyalella azteca]